MANINEQQIAGKWIAGAALDFHTLSSAPTGFVDAAGRPTFNTTRTEVGELLYRLKYNSDLTAAPDLIATAVAFLTPRHQKYKFDQIVAVPPSGTRTVQPVPVLAEGIGQALQVPVAQCLTATRPASQVKNISDPSEREAALQGLYAVDATQTTGKTILLFDDLFRSGATMNAITEALQQEGKAAKVYAFTITRTRSNR